MNTRFTFPDMLEEWNAFSTACGIVEFIQAYPDDIFPESSFENLSFFAKQFYNALSLASEEAGEILCSNKEEGAKIFFSNFLLSYEATRKNVKDHPGVLTDPILFQIQRMPSPLLAAYFLTPHILEKNKKPKQDWFQETKQLPDHCIKEGCQETELQLLATLEKLIHYKAVSVRVLSCSEHYEEAWKLCRDEFFLRTFLQKELSFLGIESNELSEIVNSFVFKKSRGKETDPLIERFRQRQRVDDKQTIAFFQEQFQTKLMEPFFAIYNDSLVDLARKYRMTPEAVALAQALPYLSYDEAITFAIQSNPCVWIEFTEPVQSPRGKIWGFSYAMENEANANYAQHFVPLPKKRFEQFKAIFYPDPNRVKWGIDAFTNDGDARWTKSMVVKIDQSTESFSWSVTHNLSMNWLGCSSGQCREDLPLCEQCKRLDAWFLSFYVNCLRVLSGEFAEEETKNPDETQEHYRIEALKVTRTFPKQDQPWKFKRCEIIHRFSVVSFDVLKQQKQQKKPVQNPRGSWMEKIAPDSSLYVRRRIEKGTRTIHNKKHFARYLETHGETIAVRAHYRWVPTLLQNLQKIYLAKAETPLLLERNFPSESC